MEGIFETLYAINTNDHKEEKNGLSYLSWTWAVAEVKKRCPDMTYEVIKNEQGLPYVYDPLTGYMVYTRVTIEGVTHEMWLPVMDGKNNAMKAEEYTVKKKKFGKVVEEQVFPATMFDINKAIMRCLTKNLAMFGLGLYIYAGEDLPESDEPESKKECKPKQSTAEEEAALRAQVLKYVTDGKMSKENIAKICKKYGVSELKDLSAESCRDYLRQIELVNKKKENEKHE